MRQNKRIGKWRRFPGAQYKPVHALFLYREGKRDAALAEFEQLAKSDPNDRSARSRLFAAYIALGKELRTRKISLPQP